jgi:hypothetical protein
MKFRDGKVPQWLSTDEAYERFFDGYYNLGRPDEIFGRNVVVGWAKAEVPRPAVRPRIAGPRPSSRRLAGIK